MCSAIQAKRRLSTVRLGCKCLTKFRSCNIVPWISLLSCKFREKCALSSQNEQCSKVLYNSVIGQDISQQLVMRQNMAGPICGREGCERTGTSWLRCHTYGNKSVSTLTPNWEALHMCKYEQTPANLWAEREGGGLPGKLETWKVGSWKLACQIVRGLTWKVGNMESGKTGELEAWKVGSLPTNLWVCGETWKWPHL